MGTAIVVVILTGLVILSVRKMVHDKKNGKSCGCGGNCGSCSGCASAWQTKMR